MQDRIEKIGYGTLIQHGELNKRVYVMKLDKRDSSAIIDHINTLARTNNYTKIFCKIPQQVAPQFFANGFFMEAQIPGFYKGVEAAFFVSKFLSSDRLLDIETESLIKLSTLLKTSKVMESNAVKTDKSFGLVRLATDDVDQIAAIYRKVFASYPFPIHNREYIKETMQNKVQYFGIKINNKLIALASAEVDAENQNAEMTDFATLPAYQGNNLSVSLLNAMEEEMKVQGIKTLYTIARLKSIGMNKTFIRQNYNYSGTLIKNTNISGGIESMNVYYKYI
ncbi:putative beta-lysine N-acetyltransferase [Prolixibacteraceae bacterium Z1-6]|uniref:Beta-lysine N-acetyltransferase n=1 Tax=Draconibacterium aestuarii TaxID=2998507 RepID=A0A9X3FAI0_9BACT|nr:putative beta-lysine N-acetyltransferase [Prolixibacteraceae bacterium Z1-6]